MTLQTKAFRLLPSRAAAAVFGVALIAGLCGPAPAEAQQIVARVNGDPITAVDVAQRTRLQQLSGGKPGSRQAVLDELINEQLKLQMARRYRIEISDVEVNQVVANMASRMRASPEQFAQALASSGVSVNALKRKLRADMAWGNIVRGKFQSSLQVRERDVIMAAREQSGQDATAYDYTLRPILLVVARSGGAGGIEARRREAEGLRSRFQNCEDGLRLARGLRDVAIREPMVRSSADLPAKLREVLDRMPIGRLTPPDITPSGVEVFALCAKTESRIRASAGNERDVREKMFSERFEKQGQKLLQQMRRTAHIEIR